MGKMSGSQKPARRVVYILYLTIIVVVLLEIGLRIINPFHLRLKGDKIVLPVDQRQIIINKINPKLDSLIYNTRNSLGFRGPNPPPDWNRRLTLITVGGSTTECHFLSDDRTWPFLLGKKLSDSFPGSWMNNAGLDGHSTFGHTILLNDHIKKLRPSIVLFLTGINDVELDGPSFHDKLNTKGAFPDLKHYIFENSEVLNLLLNLARGWRAQPLNNTPNFPLVLDKHKKLAIPESGRVRRLEQQGPFLKLYRDRLVGLADTCLARHILPVFMTQPNQFGEGKDSITGVDLSLFPVDKDINGLLMWEILERYNAVVRQVCAEKGLPLIDLAHLLPKDSRYFYDMSHFTNEGTEKVAGLLFGCLMPVFDRYFPEYRK